VPTCQPPSERQGRARRVSAPSEVSIAKKPCDMEEEEVGDVSGSLVLSLAVRTAA
jgi:hypothetical protein